MGCRYGYWARLKQNSNGAPRGGAPLEQSYLWRNGVWCAIRKLPSTYSPLASLPPSPDPPPPLDLTLPPRRRPRAVAPRRPAAAGASTPTSSSVRARGAGRRPPLPQLSQAMRRRAERRLPRRPPSARARALDVLRPSRDAETGEWRSPPRVTGASTPSRCQSFNAGVFLHSFIPSPR